MKALILAAGFGRRLQPLTNEIPKAMVPVNGVPLLIASLDKIKEIGITEVVIVVGHKHEYIEKNIGNTYKGMSVIYVCNDIYETTNNVYSLWLASQFMNDDCILLECDLLYDLSILTSLKKHHDASCVIVTSKYNRETMDGSVVSINDNMQATALYVKSVQNDDFDYSNMYKTVNIYKFSKEFLADSFLPAIDSYVNTQSVNSYYELVLGSLISSKNNSFYVLDVPEDSWCEIDDINDLERASKHIFASINQ